MAEYITTADLNQYMADLLGLLRTSYENRRGRDTDLIDALAEIRVMCQNKAQIEGPKDTGHNADVDSPDFGDAPTTMSYMGKPVEEMTKEQLIGAIYAIERMNDSQVVRLRERLNKIPKIFGGEYEQDSKSY